MATTNTSRCAVEDCSKENAGLDEPTRAFRIGSEDPRSDKASFLPSAVA